jgi:hypothetical protein
VTTANAHQEHDWVAIRDKTKRRLGIRCSACKLSSYGWEMNHIPTIATRCRGTPGHLGSFPPNYMPPDCWVENWPPEWRQKGS